jgi:hypothetical protein
MLTSLHALAALDTSHGLSSTILAGNDLDAGQILIKFLIECLGASLDALQAGHALHIFLNSELLHSKELSFSFIYRIYYTSKIQKLQRKKPILANFVIITV